jgi:hypothetical protein
MRNRLGTALALFGVLGISAVAPAPAHAAPTAPMVTLTGQLIQLADRTGPELAAVRTVDNQLVPVQASVVKRLKSGSAITLEVAVPAKVRSVAAANSTLTVRGPNGKTTSTPVDRRDLAAASDGTPEPATSNLGKATVASAVSTGQPLIVTAVILAADPVGSYTPATRRLFVAVVTPRAWTTANPITQAQINTQVANASTYWATVSGGGITLAGVATDAPRYNSAYSCSDNPFSMWSEAAGRTGFSYAANSSLVVELPKGASGCGYGLGTVGANVNDDGMLYVSDNVFPVLAHELGHNMSLQHANTLECPSVSDSAFDDSGGDSGWTGTNCQEGAYGDGQDLMAGSRRDYAPFLSSPQSLRTGIIPASAATVTSINGTTNVVLNALGSRVGVRVAKVVDPISDVTYYVEYRVATSPDTANVYGDAVGVRVLRFNPETATTVLLDPTPTATPSTDKDATLRTGITFTSYSGGVRVTTISTTPTSATVSISPGNAAPSAPTGVNAIAGDAQAVVSWTAPASNGGSPITGYTVTAAPGGRTATTTGATSATVAGLTNGTSYTFTVTATNDVATSPASAASAAVTPRSPMVGFNGLTATRVLNTAIGLGAPRAKLGAGRILTLKVPGLPAGTTAVALNVTVSSPTAASYLTVYPGGKARPGASSLNFVRGQTIPNLVLVPLGPGNTVSFFNKNGTVNVLADMVGYFAG